MDCTRSNIHLAIWSTLLLLHTANSDTVTITKTEGPGKLEIKNGVKELRVNEGESIAVTCTVKVDTDMIWGLWFGNDIGLSYNEQLLHPDQTRYSIEEKSTGASSAEFTLRILHLRMSDEGEYMCQGPPGIKDDFNLFVTTRPNITMITGLQTANVGDSVRLECRAEGSPVPSIRWRHVRPNNNLPNDIEGSYKHGGILDITSITLDDRGEYECIASNGVQHSDMVSRKTTFIRMNYPPTVEALSDHDYPVVRVRDGMPAELTCKSMAYPPSSASDVLWYFENTQLSASDGYNWEVVHQLPTEKVDPYEETTFSELIIPIVNNKTTGEYKCQFRNSKGSDNAIVVLAIAPEEGGVAGESRSKSSVLSTSLVTIVTLLFAIMWII